MTWGVVTTWEVVAAWECLDCKKGGEVNGVVVREPNTVFGPGEAEFYPETDAESGAYFAGCIFCGSERIDFGDPKPKARKGDIVTPYKPLTEDIEDFREFMSRELSPTEHLLVQAIAALSVIEPRRNMTPEEIWNELREQTYVMHEEEGS